MKTVDYNNLTPIQKKLLEEAEDVMKNAYAPYSNFYVGAAVLVENNKIITGANVENASYGNSICAERSAVLRANSMGYKVYKVVGIVGEKFAYPCGSCRQVLYEFAKRNLEIIISTKKKDKVKITTINELLPFPFILR